uniref:Uncharacterized protein n=1 Tax=Arundo donax TaxID=35708 RepID=A0A0A9QWY5_ARUDO
MFQSYTNGLLCFLLHGCSNLVFYCLLHACHELIDLYLGMYLLCTYPGFLVY